MNDSVTTTMILSGLACGQDRCRCKVAVRRGHGKTHCPVHQDNTPSFGVDQKNGKVLTFCYSGCPQERVVESLKAKGLWPEHAKYGQDIVAEYEYRDIAGKLLYQTVRYAPKDFKQRRPKTGGGWVWSLGDVARVLYRLPELVASASKERPPVIFVVEGEKDVDRLMALGLCATCNVGGAGKWRRDYAPYFKDRHVVLVIDPDDPGKQHGQQVSNMIQDTAQSVRWLELGADASDWLDAGGTVEQLRELAKAAPKASISEQLRETVFRREGLSYYFEPASAPIKVLFSRLADHSDETTAEVAISHIDGRPVARRRLNLLGATGVPKTLLTLLENEQLGIEEDQWGRIIGEGFEKVLDAHRDGLVIDVIQGDIKRPAPISWLCDGLVVKNKLNCWLGAAGTGKSTLAKILCVYYATGYKFLDRDTLQGIPLYLDWEDDREDFERVVHDVCRNLSVWPVPKFGWIKMRGKRMRDAVESLTRAINDLNAEFLVIDAIAAAGGSAGEHRSYEDIALELEQCLGLLPPITVLGLDHITSAEHRLGKQTVPTKARGAERKVEIYRNQWTLMADTEERERGRHLVSWYHTKINAAVFRPQFTVEIRHGSDELSAFETDVSESPETVERFTYKKRNELFVAANPGSTIAEICLSVRGDKSQAKKDITGKDLKRSKQAGILDCDLSGRWWPAGHPGMPRATRIEDMQWTDEEDEDEDESGQPGNDPGMPGNSDDDFARVYARDLPFR